MQQCVYVKNKGEKDKNKANHGSTCLRSKSDSMLNMRQNLAGSPSVSQWRSGCYSKWGCSVRCQVSGFGFGRRPAPDCLVSGQYGVLFCVN